MDRCSVYIMKTFLYCCEKQFYCSDECVVLILKIWIKYASLKRFFFFCYIAKTRDVKFHKLHRLNC